MASIPHIDTQTDGDCGVTTQDGNEGYTQEDGEEG